MFAGMSGLDELFEASLLVDLASIPAVRRRLGEFLRAADLGDIAGDVVLICSELMANAVVHGCRGFPPDTKITVTATCSNTKLRVVVQDPSDEEPCAQRDSEIRTSGRGLNLVASLSDRWGFEADLVGCGKLVWAEIDYPKNRTA
jgi:anti-sigma regulatory factor (Ser/Thr protein kinase)